MPETAIPDITLNDATTIPQLGFGVFRVPDDGAGTAVTAALNAGYRVIDTAAYYRNEPGTGTASPHPESRASSFTSPPRSGTPTSATTPPWPRWTKAWPI